MQLSNVQTKYSNQYLELEPKPFASGGEGVLHKIKAPANMRGLVAKIYHPNKLTANREQKINYLYKNKPLEYKKGEHTTVVWVVDVLYGTNGFVGFLMPFVEGDKLALLTLGKLPRKVSPKWKRFAFSNPQSEKLRLKLCFNIAAAIYQTHSTNQYILVDLKPDNIITQPNGLVSLVDMDSVEVIQNGKSIFDAPVATPEYTPPEHYQKTYAIDPTTSTSWDNFSMAVIFYQLLFGIHPFAASSLPPYENLTSLHQKIEKGLFIHNPTIQDVFSVIPPPHQRFKKMEPALQQLFIRCFVGGERSPETRPSAEEWCSVFASILNLSVDGIISNRMPSSLIDFEVMKGIAHLDIPNNSLALVSKLTSVDIDIPETNLVQRTTYLSSINKNYQSYISKSRSTIVVLMVLSLVTWLVAPTITLFTLILTALTSFVSQKVLVLNALKTDRSFRPYSVKHFPSQKGHFIKNTKELKQQYNQLEADLTKVARAEDLAANIKEISPLTQNFQVNLSKLRHFVKNGDRLLLQEQQKLKKYRLEEVMVNALKKHPILEEFNSKTYLSLLTALNNKMDNYDGPYHSQYRAKKMDLMLRQKEAEQQIIEQYDVYTLQNYIKSLNNFQDILPSHISTLGKKLKKQFRQLRDFPAFDLKEPDLNVLKSIFFAWQDLANSIENFNIKQLDRTQAKQSLKTQYMPLFQVTDPAPKFEAFLTILRQKMSMHSNQDTNQKNDNSLVQQEAADTAKLALELRDYAQKQIRAIQKALPKISPAIKTIFAVWDDFYAEIEELESSIAGFRDAHKLSAYVPIQQDKSEDTLLDGLLDIQHSRLEEFKNKCVTVPHTAIKTISKSYALLLELVEMLNAFVELLNDKFRELDNIRLAKQEPLEEAHNSDLKQLYQEYTQRLQEELKEYYDAKDFMERKYALFQQAKATYKKEHFKILNDSQQKVASLKQEGQYLQQQKLSIQEVLLQQEKLEQQRKDYVEQAKNLKEEGKTLSQLSILHQWSTNRTYWDYIKRLFFLKPKDK
ncbi:MAG: hypothetical protein GY810_13005 [Aureispira sp.]|nr:hypothetical protein [Aureispira sp.]